MKIVNHPLCTAVIGAPSDMRDGSCSGLPVAYTTDEYGTWALSFWKPDAEELAMLMNGGGIVLHVRAHGRQHPVIGMATYAAIRDDQPGVLSSADTAEDRAAWSSRRWAEHVGAWEDEDDQVRFGSWMAVHAMLLQFQAMTLKSFNDAELSARLARAERALQRAGFIDLGGDDWQPPVGSRWQSAAHDVLAERRRQVEQEGWTPDHDDAHEFGELAEAAMSYADPAAHCQLGVPHLWPWVAEWWKPRDRRRNLVRAAALLIAEIERLDRAAAAAGE